MQSNVFQICLRISFLSSYAAAILTSAESQSGLLSQTSFIPFYSSETC